MKISLLKKREDFFANLKATLPLFLEKKFGGKYLLGYKKSGTKEGQVWLCNSLLNIIFVTSARKAVFSQTVKEFSKGSNRLRTLLQTIFIKIVTNRYLSNLFSKKIFITPSIPNSSDLIVIGGNNHLRVNDHKRNLSYVIAKNGFNRVFMANDILLRQKGFLSIVPQIKYVDEEGLYYAEELITGIPINRLVDRKIAEKAIVQSKIYLFKLYERYRTKVFVDEYYQDLKNNINAILNKSEIRRKISNMSEVEELLSKLTVWVENRINNSKISLTMTHGDFQPANILYSEGRTWLIDWEYSSVRQIYYDALVYFLGFRSPPGLSSRLLSFCGGTVLNEAFFQNWPCIDWLKDPGCRMLAVALSILEDIQLRLIEHDSGPIFKVNENFLRVVSEYNNFLKYYEL